MTGALVADQADARALDSARRSAIRDLGYGFTPPLSCYDRENFASEAVTRTLEALDAGAKIENLTRFVKRAARNAAIDDGRREERRNRSLDAALGVSDVALGPDERLELQGQLAAAIDALREFSPEDRALFQAKKLDGKKLGEIVAATKRPRRTVSRRVREMEAAVAAAAVEFTNPQRKLLWDFANGQARGPGKLRAQWLVRHSADAATLVVKFRRLNEGAAAALPAPVAVQTKADASVVERLVGVPGRVRDEIIGRGSDAAAASSATEPAAVLAQSGAGRAGGAAAGGVLAKLGVGGALGAKGVMACIGGGAVTAACVAAGVVPGVGLDGGEKRGAPDQATVAQAAAPEELIDELPAPSPPTSGEETPSPPADATPDAVASEPAPAPAPPPAEREFGLPDAPAVTSDASTAAPGPTSSAGAGDAGGGAVAREFGGP